jgi:uncharacterized protein (DUF433 family)
VPDSDADVGASGLVERLVTSRPDILGGAPCFAGTRIPVHDIADMIANGDTAESLAAAYPQLTIDQVRAAAAFAAAHPRPVRSAIKPAWRKAAPINSQTLTTDGLPPAS